MYLRLHNFFDLALEAALSLGIVSGIGLTFEYGHLFTLAGLLHVLPGA